MNLKNYLTAELVKAGATTPRKALELSIKHWYQNTLLTEKQLKRQTVNAVAGNLCGLCVFYLIGRNSCIKCILHKSRSSCFRTQSIYRLCNRAIVSYDANPTKVNFLLWQDAAKAMHKLLCSLRGK